ncbi:MAG: tetratricopeptide repeat protein [Oscillospiraceae bacterium]|nr:tetratricopeptide repeat protein [Oscillospiraceae bacterium]
MDKQEMNALIEEIKSRMNGDRMHDVTLLEEEISRLEKQEGTEAVTEELLQMAVGTMSQEEQEYLRNTLFLDGKRLNQVYHEMKALMQQGKTAEALQLSRALYEHILMKFRESDQERFFSFRNPFESNLYHIMYHPTKTLLRAPFDFSLYISGHAYNLVEAGRAPEAIPVLKEAIRYNPVNTEPRFELAEVYKLTGDNDKLFETVMDTLPLCTSAYDISRCYANIGFWCANLRDFESAYRFYYESLNFYEHPAIPGELKHMEALSGKPLVNSPAP